MIHSPNSGGYIILTTIEIVIPNWLADIGKRKHCQHRSAGLFQHLAGKTIRQGLKQVSTVIIGNPLEDGPHELFIIVEYD